MRVKPKIVSPSQWRAALLEGQALGLSKQVADAAQVDEAGAVSFIMSDDSVDRMGDVVKQDGWVLDSFKKNPVLLWAHDYTLPPVGKVGACVVEGGKLKAKAVEFIDRELSEFAWSIGQMYRKGFLNAVSVGFAPQEFAPCETGFEFKRQELLELSAVPVPANANALVEARSLGLLVPTWKGWAEKVLDTSKQRDPSEASFALAVYKSLSASPVAMSGRSDEKGPLSGPDDSALIAVNPEEPQATEEDKPIPEVLALVDALKAHAEKLDANTAAVVAMTAALVKDAAEDQAEAPEMPEAPKALTFDTDAVARRVASLLTKGV